MATCSTCQWWKPWLDERHGYGKCAYDCVVHQGGKVEWNHTAEGDTCPNHKPVRSAAEIAQAIWNVTIGEQHGIKPIDGGVEK